jgi:DNA-binding FrmR family transcriptional regulator
MKHKQKESLNLLKTAKGQIEAIIRMTEENRYCVDIANQILAVVSLLKKANLQILEQHLKTCVRESLENDSYDKKTEEIMQILTKYMK